MSFSEKERDRLTDQTTSKQTLEFDDATQARKLFGVQDEYLYIIEKEMDVSIHSRGTQVEIEGTAQHVQLVVDLLEQLEELIQITPSLKTIDVLNGIRMAKQGTLSSLIKMYEEVIGKDKEGRPIRVKNAGQWEYVQAIKKNDVVFGVGPAGTGKTYLAVVMAVAAMRRGDVSRIVLTRPAVEAGESLGFLPGDLKEKVDPYLRPLYDALYSIFGTEHTERLLERETIEIAPLAYMRGRTLDDAFVILDEAQNTTVQQMKMFLTRLGFGSKMIINGDVTQIDLLRGTKSGLIHATHILRQVPGVARVSFSADDVVRHPLVAKIIHAYETEEDTTIHSS